MCERDFLGKKEIARLREKECTREGRNKER